MLSEPQVNVLLVDDHPENLIALEAVLEGLGQNLVKAHSGQEALRCLLNQDFAVILLDVQMPEMDGFETATLIRQRARSRRTPIIFLTAHSASDSLAFKGYALGAVDYLLKPIDPGILTSKVSVFVDLFKKTVAIEQQAAQLASINAELRQSEERFRSLSACSPVGIFLTDTNGRCTYTNPSCQAICGFQVEETWEQGWARFIHEEEHDRVLAEWSNSTRKGLAYSSEFRIYQNNEVCWVHVRTSPMLSSQGQLLGYVGTIEDITERKQAEAVRDQFIREQAARQEAEAANRMKDEFLAIVSHELRTPLTSILGWSRLLLTRNFDNETRRRALETIERNAKSQAQLIEDVLDVSKIIQGKIRLDKQPVDVAALLQNSLTSVRPLAEQKSLHLSAHVETAPLTLQADLERLRQVLWNLLSNAIKFTPEGGQIEARLEVVTDTTGAATSSSLPPNIQTSNIQTSNSPPDATSAAGSFVQISVRDTGIGIASEFLPHVFDRFRQADSTTTRAFGGLGLGLAIAHHLVELHQGQLLAHSDGEGQGATFMVRLPLDSIALPTHPDQSSQPCSDPQNAELVVIEPLKTPQWLDRTPTQPDALRHIRVLVVEDNPDTQEFVSTVLQEFGAEVDTACSVEAALQYLEQTPPHLLISDIGMPGENGYQLIHRVRELAKQHGHDIPAIALTAYTRLEDQKHALSVGFQRHLAKPIEPNDLVQEVVGLVGRSQPENLNRVNESRVDECRVKEISYEC